jgi:hypothetical protein
MVSFGATSVQLKRGKNRACSRKRRQGNGLELLPSWFVARRSIQLSYGRTRTLFTINSLPQFLLQFQRRVFMLQPVTLIGIVRNPHLCIRIPLIRNGLARTFFTFERLAPRPDALSK